MSELLEFQDLLPWDQSESETAILSRQARINQAREEANSWTPRIETPNWYLSSDKIKANHVDALRIQIFRMQNHYLAKEYSQVIQTGLDVLNSPEFKLNTGEEIEIVDMVLRAAIKDQSITEQLISYALRYKEYNRSGISVTIMLYFALVHSKDASKITTEQVLKSFLFSLQVLPYQPTSLRLLSQTLAPIYPLLSTALQSPDLDKEQLEAQISAEMQDFITKYAFTEDETNTLRKALSSSAPKDDDQPVGRDVRSL